MLLALTIVGLVIFCFGFVVLRGAPYVPTHKKWVDRAITLAPTTGTIVDLGCGDGVMLLAAARAGRRSIGVELNPVLALIAWLRTMGYRRSIQIKIGDFWRMRLPDDTSVVFVFLAGPFMHKLEAHLQREATRLSHDVVLLSYGFQLPNLQPEHVDGPLLRYRLQPQDA
ncbi:MAG TPA: methyltransferase domain-containing protein [Candidatus Saccharimonadales bacterium]|jgi:SAM-dependent methyltransferase|nr:methyltransferase domain-containing protein [Candidatus Saccharimonadales bacterium]